MKTQITIYCLFTAALIHAQTASPSAMMFTNLTDAGPAHATWSIVTRSTDAATGAMIERTNSFTQLENGTNYLPMPWCVSPPGVIMGGKANYYQHFMADDYTWVGSDGNYFYFAWCDRSRTYGASPYIRQDADVRLAKIKQ